MMEARSTYHARQEQTLSNLLIATMERKFKDPRDKNFALLRLKSPFCSMTAHYNPSMAEVFAQAALFTLNEE